MRYFFVDRVDELKPGQVVRGVKNVALSEDIFNDHFPEQPLYPGTMIVEALAQLGGLLVESTLREHESDPRRAVLGQIEKAKFHHPCRPGDQIELRCTLVSRLEGAAQVEGEASVKGRRAAQAILTFRMVSVDSDAVHRQRDALYRLWMRDLDSGPAIP
jgi:3-hydroxyacyl-[acyl-carrier-protein] dehydratase